MNQNILWLVVLFVAVLLILFIFYFFVSSTGQENFAINQVCAAGLSDILIRSMGLLDGDNSLPDNLTAAANKCIDTYDFKKLSDTGLRSRSSVLTILLALFQSTDNGVPYIDKFFDWKIKNSSGTLVPVDWAVKLDAPGTTAFQGTVNLLTNTIIPLVLNLRQIMTEIASSTDMSPKYMASANSANRAFINGFLAKYKDFDEDSASRLRTAGTEENAMFKALTDRIDYRDPIITSYKLSQAMAEFSASYLLNVSFTAAAQCNINIIDTAADNDVKLYVRLKKLLELWRGMKKKSTVAYTATDLNGSAFLPTGDYSKDSIIKYFTEELKNPVPSGTAIEEHVANVINNMINNTFITDGGVNDGRLIDDPECKSDVGKLLCNLRLDDARICQPNMDACGGSAEFNKFCTAVGEILNSANDPEITMPVLDLNNLPTTPTTTAVSTAAGTTAPAGTSAGGGSGTTAPVGTSASGGSGTTSPVGTSASGGAASTVAGGGAAATVAGGGSAGSASNQELRNRLTQYAIPGYLDRSTQELLIFVYDKLAASYNFDDDEVPDDIKQAISQLPPSGRANICARYCPLTMRCNAVCKLAGCLNCQVGTGAQAGSEADGAPSSSLGYAGVDDDYGLLGFLDDISQSKLVSGSSAGTSGLGSGQGQDLYKHMGPMISQKDTSGVSNIFAPYIIMAPKKDGTEYGAYLLDDPNDPQYQQYINDLVKSY